MFSPCIGNFLNKLTMPGSQFCLPRVPRKAARSSHSETVYLNSRDLEAVASFLSCPGNRSDHTHCSMRHGLALASEGLPSRLFR